MTTPQPLLIIVHPGSACGSADMNLGNDAAAALRVEMQILIENWSGAVAVIDGELSDELNNNWKRGWTDLGEAIEGALARASEAGLLSARIMGDDNSEYNQQMAVADLVRDQGLTPDATQITLTGAWIDDEGDGCVHSVRETLEELGFSPRIEDAMNLDFSLDGDDDDFGEDENEEPAIAATTAPSPRTRRAGC